MDEILEGGGAGSVWPERRRLVGHAPLKQAQLSLLWWEPQRAGSGTNCVGPKYVSDD